MLEHNCTTDKFISIPEVTGPAITECWQDSTGTLWVSNGEYSSTVNFCPYCGYKAPKQLESRL